MKVKIQMVILCCIVLLLTAGMCIAASPSVMPMTLKINKTAPYDDDKFKSIVDPAIKGLSSTTLTASERMDLQDIYYQASDMKVSKEFYPVAYNATSFLFYLISYNEYNDEYNDEAGLGAFSQDTKDELRNQAKADAAEAESLWQNLISVYPNSTLYRK